MSQTAPSTTVRKSRLTDGQLVLMGKGLFAKVKPAGTKPYALSAGPVVDQAQSDLNRQAGYWSAGRGD